MVKKKKITCIAMFGRGGVFHYAATLAGELTELADVTLVAGEHINEKTISKKLKLIKIHAPVNRIKATLSLFNVSQHKKTIKKINSEKPDIVNFMDVHPLQAFYFKRIKAKKKVVTIHDPELHSGETGRLESAILQRVTRYLLKNADEIIVLGKKQEETIRKIGYRQKIIRSSIGHFGFLDNKLKIKTEMNTFIFFGRIREYKGLNYLLKALRQIKTDFKLIIAGEGDLTPYEKDIKALKGKLEIHNKYLPDEEMEKLFRRSEFTVLPYTDATQTAVVQVAYYFKNPAIVTNVGSLPETTQNGKTGLVVPPKNVPKLKLAIESMLKNKKMTKKMGEAAYKYLNTELNWKKITKKLYSELIKGKDI